MIKIADFRWKNADVSRIQEVCLLIHFFLGPLLVSYNRAKFHQRRICVTDVYQGSFLPPPFFVSNPKMAHLNDVKISKNLHDDYSPTLICSKNTFNITRTETEESLFPFFYIKTKTQNNELISDIWFGRFRVAKFAWNSLSFLTKIKL